MGSEMCIRDSADITQDFFALRKVWQGGKWVFSESRNTLNPASHCDIAWGGALSSHADAGHVDQYFASVC